METKPHQTSYQPFTYTLHHFFTEILLIVQVRTAHITGLSWPDLGRNLNVVYKRLLWSGMCFERRLSLRRVACECDKLVTW